MSNRIVMFHGTSDLFAGKIRQLGLASDPPQRLSKHMADDDGQTVSLPGSYLTVSPGLADSYAKQAARYFGGRPMLVTASVSIERLIPDEDEVNFALGWPIALALGWDDSLRPDDPFPMAWTLETAMDAVTKFIENSESKRPFDKTALASCLYKLIAPATSGWEGCQSLFNPDFNDSGWSSSVWARKLAATAKGLTHYRTEMDRFCRHLAGLEPHSYPCGLESCKGRVVEGVSFGSSPHVIVGMGTSGSVCILAIRHLRLI